MAREVVCGSEAATLATLQRHATWNSFGKGPSLLDLMPPERHWIYEQPEVDMQSAFDLI